MMTVKKKVMAQQGPGANISFRRGVADQGLAAREGPTIDTTAVVRNGLVRYYTLMDAIARDLPTELNVQHVADCIAPLAPLEPMSAFALESILKDPAQIRLVESLPLVAKMAVVDLAERLLLASDRTGIERAVAHFQRNGKRHAK